MSHVIHSDRLDLIPLTPAFLRAVLEKDFARAANELGAAIPDNLLEYADVISLRLQQLEAGLAFQQWSLRAMVLRDRRLMIGHIGFHTAPAPEYLRSLSPEGAEFGFTVEPPFRRRGFAREASLALMDWAHQTHGVTRFVLSISPDNAPSRALAAALGFVRIGSHIDDVDGLEDVFEHRLVADDGAAPAQNDG